MVDVDIFLEDHNKFDKNAVAIVFETDTVGYLSREDAVKYRAEILNLGYPQAIGTCAARITGGGENRSYGIQLDLDLHELQVEKISKTQEPVSATQLKNKIQNPKIKKNKVPFVFLIILACLLIGAIGAIVDQGVLILENAGYRPTRTATLAPTLNHFQEFNLTLTALHADRETPTP